MYTHLRSLLIALVWLAGLVLVACGDDDGGGNTGGQNVDLTISSIALDPAQPTAGEPFTITVKVENQGRAESGSYAVTVTLRDVTREERFPVGTFTGDPIKAGGDATVYEGAYTGLDRSGNYQVQVQIVYDAIRIRRITSKTERLRSWTRRRASGTLQRPTTLPE